MTAPLNLACPVCNGYPWRAEEPNEGRILCRICGNRGSIPVRPTEPPNRGPGDAPVPATSVARSFEAIVQEHVGRNVHVKESRERAERDGRPRCLCLWCYVDQWLAAINHERK